MAIDYQAEYDNRARVPEHPEIFARWNRDAAAYRDLAAGEGRAQLNVKFGPSPRQFVDLFLPKDGDTTAFAMFVHGGYWRSLEPAMFSHMARGLNAHGVAVAVSGYDLVPQVTIADIIAQTQRACLYLWWRFHSRVLVTGHSAGGHLAACMLATDWKAQASDVPANLVPAAYSISGMFDLSPILHLPGTADFKLDAAEVKRVSPMVWPAPQGLAFDLVAGSEESSEFRRQSRDMADAWQPACETRYEELAGANHFTSCDPMADPHSAMVERLAALARRVRATGG